MNTVKAISVYVDIGGGRVSRKNLGKKVKSITIFINEEGDIKYAEIHFINDDMIMHVPGDKIISFIRKA